MKKKICILLIILLNFIFISKVNALSSLTCEKESYFVGDNIVCTVKTDTSLKITSAFVINNVEGEGNSFKDKEATFTKDGKITFKSEVKGTYKISFSTLDSSFSDTLTILVNSVTTTKSTTTSTTTTTQAKSNNNFLASITIDNKKISGFDKEKNKYNYIVNYNTKQVKIVATAEDKNAFVDVDGPAELKVGDNEFVIAVTSEDNTTKFYKVIITREDEVSANTRLSNIIIKGYKLDFDGNSKTYYLDVKPKTEELNITVKPEDETTTYNITGNEDLKNGSVIKILVTAENNETDTYRIIINKAAEKKESAMLPLIIGIFAVILIAIIIIIIVMKRKKKNNIPSTFDDDITDVEIKEENNAIEEVEDLEQTKVINLEDFKDKE